MTEAMQETLEEVAAGWLARRRSGTMTEQEAQDLELWLAADAGHREAFDHVDGLWRLSAGLRTDPQIMGLRDAAMAAHPPRRRRWIAAGAAMAASVAVVAGGFDLVNPGAFGGPQQQVFSTGVGQTATVTLEDGSIVTLDTNTRLRARETSDSRLVRLDRGQAFFKVAKDPARPFSVTAGGRTITALGTAFNVRLDKGKVEVVLEEGRVKVSAAPAPLLAPRLGKAPEAEMTPGSRLVTAGGDQWRIAKVDVSEATSWRRGQLVFVRRPLSEVAAEINRYSERKIVIHDEALAHTPITGGFAVGDVDAFVEAVESYGLAFVATNSENSVVLEAD